MWTRGSYICTDIPLFTSPFFRDCLCPFWNSSRSKNCILVVKPHGFVVYSVTHRMRPSPPHLPPPKSGTLFIWTLALSLEGCDECCDTPVMWWGRNLAMGFMDKINLFFFFIYIYIYIYLYVCFEGNVALSVWLSSVLPCTSVCDYWLLTAISVNGWQYQSMYVSMYYIQNNFFLSFFLLLKLFLLYF